MSPDATQQFRGISALHERYRLLSRLGSGGMADVFLGVQLGEQNFNRFVVIKRIHSTWLSNESAIKMFIDEAQIVATLNHPHIVKIFDLSRLDRDICITMEYVDGENLEYIRKALRKAEARMPLPIVCKLMIEACEALHYAHSALRPDGRRLSLIHRDIAPNNLMLTSNGYLKVIDFGIAKSAQSELTVPGMIKGKFAYMAPDLFRFNDIDGRVDIYSLGLVFYELVTLKKPFIYSKDVTVAQVIDRVLNDPLPAPSEVQQDLPRELDEIIMKAVHKDRDARYLTGEDLAADIRSFAEGFGGLASSADVEGWQKRQFAERLAKRRDFEKNAMEKASQLIAAAQQNPQSLSLSPKSINESPTSLSPMSISTDSSHPTSFTPTNPYVFLLVVALVFFAGALVVHQLFFKKFETTPPRQLQVPPAVGTVENNLLIVSNVPDAEIFVDGKRVGNPGEKGLSFTIEPGKTHSLTLRKEGYRDYTLQLTGEPVGQRKVEANLAMVEPLLSPGPAGEPAPRRDGSPGNRQKTTVTRSPKKPASPTPRAKPEPSAERDGKAALPPAEAWPGGQKAPGNPPRPRKGLIPTIDDDEPGQGRVPLLEDEPDPGPRRGRAVPSLKDD